MARCCIECFNESFLRAWISENGERGKCNFCGAGRVPCVDCTELTDLFEPLLRLYEPTEYGEHYHPEIDLDAVDVGEQLPTLLDDDWEVFSDALDLETKSRLLDAIRNLSLDPKDRMLETGSDELWTPKEKRLFHEDESALWERFCYHVKHERRFIPKLGWSEKTPPQEWLEDVPESWRLKLQTGKRFYRVRCKVRGRGVPLPPEEMGAPPPEKARAGRANPWGIPMLYLASDPATAIAEVRAAPGVPVSVATMVITKGLNVIDLTQIPPFGSPFECGKNLTQELGYRAIFRCLSEALAQPVDAAMAEIEYVPTQYLVEAIKDAGLDGVKYVSSQGTGWNLVLFEVDVAQPAQVDAVIAT